MPISTEFFDGTFGISTEVAAVTASFYLTLYHEERSAKYCEFKNIRATTEFDEAEAAVTLLHLSRKFSEVVGMNGLETDMSVIQNFLEKAEITLENKKKQICKCQIITFDETTGNLLHIFPAKYNDTIRPLFLLGKKQEGRTVLTGIITNIVQYFEKSKFSFYCFFCDKRVTGKGTSHKCRVRRSCFACHKYLLRPDTYLNVVMKSMYCTDEMIPTIKKTCPTCNVSLRNSLCESIHYKKICRFGWFCLKCQKYTFRNKFVQSIQEIKDSHKCSKKICYFCGASYSAAATEKEHLCTLQKIQASTHFTKLAFLQMSFRGQSPASCLDCMKGKVCDFCLDEKTIERPNIGVLFLENVTGVFDSYTFADPDLFDYVEKKETILKKKYFPDNILFSQKSSGKTTYFNQIQKIKVDKETFSGLSVVDQILQFILQKDFSTTTLIVNGRETNELCFFVETLIQYGFKPKILKSQNRIILVECPEMCLRVVDAQNYVSSSYEEIAEQEHLNFHFFPKKWNKKSQYNYCGPCPLLSSFFFFEDTPADEKKKITFIESFRGLLWNF